MPEAPETTLSYEGLYGKEEFSLTLTPSPFTQSSVLNEVTPAKQTAWDSQTQKRETTLKLQGFLWERGTQLQAHSPKVVFYMK